MHTTVKMNRAGLYGNPSFMSIFVKLQYKKRSMDVSPFRLCFRILAILVMISYSGIKYIFIGNATLMHQYISGQSASELYLLIV